MTVLAESLECHVRQVIVTRSLYAAVHVCVLRIVAGISCVMVDVMMSSEYCNCVCDVSYAVRQAGAGRPRSDLSLEKKEDLEKRLESMSGCLTNRPRKSSAPGKGSLGDAVG